MQDRVELPELVTPVGSRLQFRLAGEMVSARLTGPLNPWRAVIVIVEGPDCPARIVTEPGLDAIVKSWTM